MIGNTIKRLRLKHHLTQEALAEKIFVTRNAVSKWERNKGLPSIENIQRMCDLLNVSMDELTDFSQPHESLKWISLLVGFITVIMVLIYYFQKNAYSYSMTLFLTIQSLIYFIIALFVTLNHLNEPTSKKDLNQLYTVIIISLLFQGLIGLLEL